MLCMVGASFTRVCLPSKISEGSNLYLRSFLGLASTRNNPNVLLQVCFSCRAFWRRAHKKTKNPNFVCTRGDSCVITVANRRKCKKCRFRLCQEAGMTESAILTEEQKKLRFRKMLQKREAMMNHQNGTVKEESKSPQNTESTYLQQMSVGCQCIEI